MNKYLSRFGFIFFVFIVTLIFLSLIEEGSYRLLVHKIMLVSLGTGLSELTWLFFFKPIFGEVEGIRDKEKFRTVILFRGILYASIILGLTIGV